jgi:hydroxypyruvate isomerase
MPDFTRRSLLAAAPALAASTPALLALPSQDPDPAKPARTPRTKFAANLEMWWGKLPFLDRIRAAAALGFPAIEFWPWRGKDLPAIAELTGELGLEIAQCLAWFNPGINDPQNHDRFVEEIEASCEAAKTLRTTKMTVIGGDDAAGMAREQMHDNIITALKRAAPICERNDLMLILEPLNIRVDHKGHCLSRSEDAVRICRAVGSTHVKINWDLYHMQITEGDLCGHLREGFDQVGYLQIADHPGRFEPGTGEIFYNRVLEEAWDLGYRGYVGVECRPKTDETTAARGLWRADQW